MSKNLVLMLAALTLTVQVNLYADDQKNAAPATGTATEQTEAKNEECSKCHHAMKDCSCHKNEKKAKKGKKS